MVDLLSTFVIIACKQRRRVQTQLKWGASEVHIWCGMSVTDLVMNELLTKINFFWIEVPLAGGFKFMHTTTV